MRIIRVGARESLVDRNNWSMGYRSIFICRGSREPRGSNLQLSILYPSRPTSGLARASLIETTIPPTYRRKTWSGLARASWIETSSISYLCCLYWVGARESLVDRNFFFLKQIHVCLQSGLAKASWIETIGNNAKHILPLSGLARALWLKTPSYVKWP